MAKCLCARYKFSYYYYVFFSSSYDVMDNKLSCSVVTAVGLWHRRKYFTNMTYLHYRFACCGLPGGLDGGWYTVEQNVCSWAFHSQRLFCNSLRFEFEWRNMSSFKCLMFIYLFMQQNIGVARGCSGWRCTQGREFFLAEFIGVSCKCTPGGGRSQFSEEIFARRGRVGGWKWLM